jgi:hypothetical protein
VVDAVRAEELYDKVGKGEKLSREEREELDLLMRENESDQEFSRGLITALGGPGGVIRTHNELTDRAYHDETGRKRRYLGMDRHLADGIRRAASPTSGTSTGDPRGRGTAGSPTTPTTASSAS